VKLIVRGIAVSLVTIDSLDVIVGVGFVVSDVKEACAAAKLSLPYKS
jgi:hypothetical protein